MQIIEIIINAGPVLLAILNRIMGLGKIETVPPTILIQKCAIS